MAKFWTFAAVVMFLMEQGEARQLRGVETETQIYETVADFLAHAKDIPVAEGAIKLSYPNVARQLQDCPDGSCAPTAENTAACECDVPPTIGPYDTT